MRHNRADFDGHEPECLPLRMYGDPPHRCLWCGAWKCDAPLRKCDSCQREYETMAAAMPPAFREVVP